MIQMHRSVTALLLALALTLGACADDSGSGRLTARPGTQTPDATPNEPQSAATDGRLEMPSGGRAASEPPQLETGGDLKPGESYLTLNGRDALIYVPPSYKPGRPLPLVIELHGASSSAKQGIRPFVNAGAEAILIAPKAQGPTWDLTLGGFGPDLESIDELLEYAFEHYAIDRSKIGILGFSDGASYALSLGLVNGDLFSHVIALAPGYFDAPERSGEPKIFIGHGREDGVLSFEGSQDMAEELRADGYDVTFEEHPGSHEPGPVAPAAVAWFERA